MRRTWTEPTLFAPEEVPASVLRVDLTVWLDGPLGRVELWRRIAGHPSDEVVLLEGGDSYRLDTALEVTQEVLADLIREAMRRLSPF